MTLEYTEYQNHSVKDVKTLVVFIHGYGSNMHDLITLAPELEAHVPNAKFYALNAPFPFEMGVFEGRQWYSLMDRSTPAMLDGYKDAVPYIDDTIAHLCIKHNLSRSDIILAGFSQGGMITLHYGLSSKHPFKGLICYSGYVLDDDSFSQSIKSKPKTLVTHGDMDPVVPFDSFKYTTKKLKENGVPYMQFGSAGLGHGIDYGCIEQTAKFLKTL